MSTRHLLVLAILGVLAAAPAARADDPGPVTATCACDATPAACDAGCACDTECAIDWSVDECAAPDSGCAATPTDPDEATLEALEDADPQVADPVDWTVDAAAVSCPDGATLQDGQCLVSDPAAIAGAPAEVSGGCDSGGTPAWWIGGAVLGLVVVARRRRALLALALVACTVGADSWDDAVDAGPTGDAHAFVDIYAGELGDAGAAQYLLANQALGADARQPTAQFSLSAAKDGVPILRAPGACGDRLVTSPADGAELLGWAHAQAGDGTAELVELLAPDGCSYSYETDPDAIAGLVAQGYTQTAVLGHVWPPGLGATPIDEPATDETALATPACKVTTHSPVELLYASPGKDYTARFLLGCPGEVIVGDKHELGPHNAMTDPVLRAAGGRTAFVLDRNGDKLRALLDRPNGVERTAAYLRQKLKDGYDYIVIDEVTAAPDYADGQSLNRRLRALLLRMPPRTIIPYISIDLTQEPYGGTYLRDRRLLMRAFEKRARVLALEVYLHTGQVMAGEAPSVFRRAADRLALAVKGMRGTGGINLHAISTIATSMHSSYPQYRYLDQPAHDLAAITRQVNAIRHGSKRLRQQRGIGWYFVNESDMTPAGHAYSYAGLIRRMRTQALRFRK